MFFINAAFTQNQNSSSEEETVKSVIMNETKSWAARNYDGWSNAWLHEKYISRMWSDPYTFVENLSWDSVNVGVKSEFKEYSTPLNADFSWSDWNIRIFNDCAWVSYIQTSIYEGDKEHPYQNREIRFLEKKNGLWKFVYLNSVSITAYQQLQTREAEYDLNSGGYRLLNQNKTDEAIEVFKLNVKLYPKSSNVYDSLGESYMKNGDKELAIQNYQRSLELDPKNENAKNMLNKLEEK